MIQFFFAIQKNVVLLWCKNIQGQAARKEGHFLCLRRNVLKSHAHPLILVVMANINFLEGFCKGKGAFFYGKMQKNQEHDYAANNSNRKSRATCESGNKGSGEPQTRTNDVKSNAMNDAATTRGDDPLTTQTWAVTTDRKTAVSSNDPIGTIADNPPFPTEFIQFAKQLRYICVWFCRDYWDRCEDKDELDCVNETIIKLERNLDLVVDNISELAAFEFRKSCYYDVEPPKTEQL